MSTEMPTFEVGLRFDRRDANLLSVLAERARQHELDPTAAKLFADSADAARSGEPLIVICASRTEAIVMADGYLLYGVRRPSIEALAPGA